MWKELARVRSSNSTGESERRQAREELTKMAAKMQKRTGCGLGKLVFSSMPKTDTKGIGACAIVLIILSTVFYEYVKF